MTWRGRAPHGDDARLGKACSCRLCSLHRGEDEISTLRAKLVAAERVVAWVQTNLKKSPHGRGCLCSLHAALAAYQLARSG